jgi:hypothetical protein
LEKAGRAMTHSFRFSGERKRWVQHTVVRRLKERESSTQLDYFSNAVYRRARIQHTPLLELGDRSFWRYLPRRLYFRT